jgi:hypothetical protein
MQNDILAEAEKLITAKREDHLALAKESYIRKMQTMNESWLLNTLIGLSSAYSGIYPEIDTHIEARAVDLSIQFAEALSVILRRELFGGEAKPAKPEGPIFWQSPVTLSGGTFTFSSPKPESEETP